MSFIKKSVTAQNMMVNNNLLAVYVDMTSTIAVAVSAMTGRNVLLSNVNQLVIKVPLGMIDRFITKDPVETIVEQDGVVVYKKLPRANLVLARTHISLSYANEMEKEVFKLVLRALNEQIMLEGGPIEGLRNNIVLEQVEMLATSL